MKARIQVIICGSGWKTHRESADGWRKCVLCEILGFCHGAVEVFSLLGQYAVLVGS